jgi:hypothetical protein
MNSARTMARNPGQPHRHSHPPPSGYLQSHLESVQLFISEPGRVLLLE